ncbi:ABC transporter ATP-binding protein [Paenibacillus sp. RRE4]|uniref:ABC transporter ATP-binding protein n=1 Tax=Paenibacillus sp. RRE4 TaxID=2962587 RepID=UPI002880DB88|nr:ABC transporter ATP-binding protein [Paenibacillus sp. RRE4]MDT0125880.1 ABC transporter ATP-binding protein [Paenibacillus sp. RRE4]
MAIVLESKKLVKTYGDLHAIRNVDLLFKDNTIYGLLGPNGAGKTTLMDMLSGGIFPSGGTIKVQDEVLKQGNTPKGMCYVREKNIHFSRLKVAEVMKVAASFYENWDWEFTKQLLQLFDMNPNKKVSQLSRGTQSLVGNIIGLASRAPITLFDEPVLGLDVIMREKFYNVLLDDYVNHPRTIIISTHLLDEISKIVEEIYIINKGSILLNESMEEIRSKSYIVSGKPSALKVFLSNKNILKVEDYGNMEVATVFDDISDVEKRASQKLDISITGLPLQRLFTDLVGGARNND